MRESRARDEARRATTPLTLVGDPRDTQGSPHENLRGDDAGLLYFPYSVSHMNVGAANGRESLYQATFSGPPPAIDVQGDLLRVAPRLRDRFSLRPTPVDLRLNRLIPWEIDARGDLFSFFADLASIDLRGASVRGVARDVVLQLGAPFGRVPLRIAGGARRLDLRLPAGSSASVYLQHEPTNSRIEGYDVRRRDRGRSVRIGAGDEARDHYQIELLGDCDRVTVTTRSRDIELAAA